MSVTANVTRRTRDAVRRGSMRGKDHQQSEAWIVVVAYLYNRTAFNATCHDRIQAVRQEWDDAYARWVPHITLIPPFVVQMPKGGDNNSNKETNPLSSIGHELQTTCSNHRLHTIALNSVGKFNLRSYSNIHLRPSSSQTSLAELKLLQSDLNQSLSSYTVHKRGKKKEKEFHPHLSLGQSRSSEDEKTIREAVEGLEVECTIDSVALLAKPQGRSGMYDLVKSVELGL
ncbi:unnamed protein product [Sympodiomycopsis kandeliae]